MGDAKLQDARYDEFQSQNPSASYDDLTSVPGDAVAQCVADEVLRTNVHRCALIVNASKELVARWAQSQFRLKRSRSLQATGAPGPPRTCRNVTVCGLATLTQSQCCDYCCQKCASSQGLEHDDHCRFHQTDEPSTTSETGFTAGGQWTIYQWTSDAPGRHHPEPEAPTPNSTVPPAGGNGSGDGPGDN